MSINRGMDKEDVVHIHDGILLSYSFFFFFLFAFSRGAPAAYGDSQARGRIRAIATGLRQSHSKVGSKPLLQPPPQLTATPDPQPTGQGQGLNPQPQGS